MATDFKTLLDEERNIALFAYVYISGIPYVFSNLPVMPAAWALPAGYTWNNSLVWFREGNSSVFDSVSQDVDLKEGMPCSGSVDVEFSVNTNDSTDVWVNMIAPTTRTKWSALPGSDPVFLSDSPASITMLDATGIVAGTDLYKGLETLDVTGVVGVVVTATRGMYGSQRIHIGPRDWSEIHTGGPIEYTSWPTVWRGRMLEVWLAACRLPTQHSGSVRMVPIDNAPKLGYSRMVFRGPVAEWAWGTDHTSVRFTAQTIDQLLDHPVLERTRTYAFGPQGLTGTGWMVVEEDGPALIEYDAGDDTVGGGGGLGAAELNIVTLGYITEGLHSSLEVGRACAEALETALSTVHVEFTLMQDQSDWTWRTAVQATGSLGGAAVPIGYVLAGAPLCLRVKTALDPTRSVLPCMGFTDDVIIGPGGNSATGHISTVVSQEQIPDYYLATSNTLLYWHHPGLLGDSTWSDDFDDPPQDQGTTRIDGVDDGTYVRLGTDGEVVELAFRTGAGVWQNPAVIVSRGHAGTQSKPIMVPYGQSESSDWVMKVGLCFPFHRLLDVLRWIACSSGDTSYPVSSWNVLPFGFGAGINPSYFDDDSFYEVELSMTLPCRGWWIEEQTNLRDLFGAVAKGCAISFLPVYGSSGYTIGAKNLLGASTYDTRSGGDLVHLDEDWTVSVTGPAVPSMTEMDIFNRIRFKFGLRPDGSWQEEDNSLNDSASIEAYGATEAHEVEYPWVAASEGDDSRSLIFGIVMAMGNALLGFFANPHPQIIVQVANYNSWCVDVGDVVLLTHPKVIDLVNGGVGLDDLPMRVKSKTDHYGPGSDITSELTLIYPRTAVRYCPSLTLKSHLLGNTYEVAAHHYTRSTSSDEDITAWADAATESWAVAVRLTYDYSSRVTRTVTGVTPATPSIIFDAALPAAILADLPHAVVEFQTMPNVVSSQLLHVFLADDASYTTTGPAAVEYEGPRWR